VLHDGFASATLAEPLARELEESARRCRGAVLTMTTLAASGHPGGSFSSMEILTLLYSFARLRPSEPRWADRDRVIVSHGHTSPGVYSALAAAGFFDIDDAVAHFRQAGSPFEGHVERSVPGVEWSTGNLGQGLSAGVGSALAARMTRGGWRTFVAMSDAEQHKGQVGEARRLAVKEGLSDLTVVVDLNGIQISGRTRDVLPVDVAADYRADGWGVIEADGHDVRDLYAAIASAVAEHARPVAVLARTVIGKGVPFMEGDPEYHGRALSEEEYVDAMTVLGLAPGLQAARERRTSPWVTAPALVAADHPELKTGSPREYGADHPTDCRSAWGAALLDIAQASPGVPLAVLDCDLAASVKTEAFAIARPESFVECGVGEHNAATVAGALAVNGVAAFWSDFGVFGIDEVYNQQRLNDINGAPVRLAVTHCGLDVGEDGRTHQCVDYVGTLRNLFGWRVIVPADADQTDRAVRAMVAFDGPVALCVGRSKLPAVLMADGSPAFGGDWEFRYGAIDRVRDGTDAYVLAMGTPVGAAIAAADALRAAGVSVAVGVTASPLELDEAEMEFAARAGLLVTVEDHNVRTGLAASVAEWLALSGRTARLLRIGVEGYATSGRSADVLARSGLDAGGIAAVLKTALL